jgi:hypothetical protein
LSPKSSAPQPHFGPTDLRRSTCTFGEKKIADSNGGPWVARH